MKRINHFLAVATVSLALTGCGLYNTYESKVEPPSDVYGTEQGLSEAVTDGSLAELSWRQFFTDPKLQQLIEQVLENNTDLNSARIAIEQSEASLKAAKLAYLPSLYFSPSGSLSSFDHARQPCLRCCTAVLHVATSRPPVGDSDRYRQPVECLVRNGEGTMGKR